jgi:hypothetical protein
MKNENNNIYKKVINSANEIQSRGGVIARQNKESRLISAKISTPSQIQEEQQSSAKSTAQSSIDSEKLIESLKTKYRRERRKNDPDLRKMTLVKAEYLKIKNDSSQNAR